MAYIIYEAIQVATDIMLCRKPISSYILGSEIDLSMI